MPNPIIAALFGGGGKALSGPIEAVGNVLDKLFTSKDEKLSREEAMMRLLQQPSIAQTEINKIEAQHRSRFVAGWRPFIGWVCGTALLYNFIIRDIVAWVIRINSPALEPPPELAMEHLLTVLMGMLGLGTLRTYEKLKGKAK
jgi:hypothetical protein